MQKHYWGLVNSQDQIQGEEGALYLFEDRDVADHFLARMNRDRSPDTTPYYRASFTLIHAMTYGKVK